MNEASEQPRPTRRRRPAALVAVGLALALVAGACGDDDKADNADNAGTEAPAALGVTDSEITLGLEFLDNAAAIAQQTGAKGIAAGDHRVMLEKAVAALNARGGILGRTIKPVYHGYDVMTTQAAAEDQKACTTFTQDNEVFAALTLNTHSDSVRTCLEDKGVVNLAQGGLTSADAETYRQFSHYVEAGSINLDRLSTVLVDQLVESGFLTPAAKVGVVAFDTPAYARALDTSLKPALQKAGIKLVEEASMKQPLTAAELPTNGAAIQGAVLKFKASGVDRVIFLESNASLAFLFLPTAEAQGYRPRYALTTQDGGSLLAANVPKPQLQGAEGLGWSPDVDVAEADAPAPTAARTACFSLMEEGGERLPSGNARGLATQVCDQLAILEAALKASGKVTADGFVNGLEELESGLDSAATFQLRYGKDRHDGVAGVRRVAVDQACGCIRYRGGNIRI